MEQSFKSSSGTSSININLDENPDSNLVDVALWRRGNGNGTGLLSRIKLALYVLVNGHAYADMVSLTAEDAVRLGASITQLGEIAVFRESERHRDAHEAAFAKVAAEVMALQQPSSPPS